MRSSVGFVCAAAVALSACAPRTAVKSSQPGPQDPVLRMGTLPNGLRYYVRENTMPEDRAYLWLAVNAGSVLEDDDQQGFAHFLEHMAFNGTKNFPGQSLIDFIEGSGMRFGADLNAYTNFDETVYQLTVPTDDSAYLANGLQIIQDWASGDIIIDSLEVVKERGVVLGEWRTRSLRDSVGERLSNHIWDVLFDTTVYRRRSPIGLPELLKTAEAPPIRRFYKAWYRPDLMAVIAVGDFDGAQVEQEIRKRFGAIAPPAKKRERFEPVMPAAKEPVVDILRDKVSPSIEILWRAPERPADANEALRQQLVGAILGQHIQRTLLDIRDDSVRPFIYAALGRQRVLRPWEVIAAQITTWPDSTHSALARVVSELERVAQHGLPEAKLEKLKAGVLRQLEAAAASAAARPSPAFVREYTQHYLTGSGDLMSPAQRLELARALVPGITPEVMARGARFWREREGLKIMVRVPMFAIGFAPPTRESVLAIFDSVARTKQPPFATAKGIADTRFLENEPQPGKVEQETLHAKAGVYEWRLSNGARVLFKPSRNHPDEVLLRAWSAGGLSRLPDTMFYGTGRMIGPIMSEAAGAGERSHDELLDQLANSTMRPLRVNVGYAEETMDLGGSPQELETMFQLMYAQFTTPKLDAAALKTWANVARFTVRPASIHDSFNQLFARGNPRLLPVRTHLADLADPDEALAAFRNRFGNAADFTFMIVGAATPEEVRPLVERYIASLPSTGQGGEQPDDPEIRPFVGNASNVHRVLPIPLAQTLIVFDAPFPVDSVDYFAERDKLDALSYVLTRRLREKLREELGGTYGVAVLASTFRLYDEHFRVMIQFQSAPEQMYDLNAEMKKILDALRKEGPTVEELRAAERVRARRLQTALQDNNYWLDRLELHNRLGLPIDRILNPYGSTQLTPESMRDAARRFLPEKAFVQLTQMPKKDEEK